MCQKKIVFSPSVCGACDSAAHFACINIHEVFCIDRLWLNVVVERAGAGLFHLLTFLSWSGIPAGTAAKVKYDPGWLLSFKATNCVAVYYTTRDRFMTVNAVDQCFLSGEVTSCVEFDVSLPCVGFVLEVWFSPPSRNQVNSPVSALDWSSGSGM